MHSYCVDLGWHWEPQAPQMPYSNNLDLFVFPMMLKRHSALLQEYSGGVAPSNKIWQTTETVWNALPAAEIARGFVLARRTLGKVVSSNGDNSFLQGGNFI